MTSQEKAQNAAFRFVFQVLGVDPLTLHNHEMAAVLVELGFADYLEGTYLRHEDHSEIWRRVTQFRRAKPGGYPTVTIRLSNGSEFFQAEIAFEGNRKRIVTADGSCLFLADCVAHEAYEWVANWLSKHIRYRYRRTRTCMRPELQNA